MSEQIGTIDTSEHVHQQHKRTIISADHAPRAPRAPRAASKAAETEQQILAALPEDIRTLCYRVLNSPTCPDTTQASYRLACAREQGEVISIAVMRALLPIIRAREKLARASYRRNKNRRLKRIGAVPPRSKCVVLTGDAARAAMARAQSHITYRSNY